MGPVNFPFDGYFFSLMGWGGSDCCITAFYLVDMENTDKIEFTPISAKNSTQPFDIEHEQIFGRLWLTINDSGITEWRI